MRTLIEEHGGAVATAAVVIIVIAMIVLLGKSTVLQNLFTNLLTAFEAGAKSAAGF